MSVRLLPAGGKVSSSQNSINEVGDGYYSFLREVLEHHIGNSILVGCFSSFQAFDDACNFSGGCWLDFLFFSCPWQVSHGSPHLSLVLFIFCGVSTAIGRKRSSFKDKEHLKVPKKQSISQSQPALQNIPKRNATRLLESLQRPYFTYTLQEEKKLHVVIRGLPNDYDPANQNSCIHIM
ncbi:hypothetical protein HUJ05_007717 [Dendroctonus ponderosae]|nr:hypothetical protein HUJ05_007717 [Dendroctonus ponderosae]